MNVNTEYFSWKFLYNPAGSFEGYAAVTENGELAAYYCVIPEVYMINGQETIIYQSCDAMTHSEHRRKGLFEKLAMHCNDYLASGNKLFLIAFGGGLSTPGFFKFGWKHVFNLKYYFIPNLFPTPKTNRDVTVELIDDISLLEPLFLKSNNKAVIHSLKSVDIYKWRISSPLYKYNVLAHKSSDNTYDSYLCYCEDNGKIVLFDFYFENKLSAKALILEIKIIMHFKKYKGILALVQENSIYSLTLKKLGFLSNPFSKGPLSEKVPFIFYSTQENLKRFNDKNKWLINSFDYDAM